MELKDLFLTPVFLAFIYLTAYIAKRNVPEKQLRKYFIPGLSVRIFGAIILGLIYQFYYGNGGDTFNFVHYGTSPLFDILLEHPLKGLQFIFNPPSNPIGEDLKLASRIYYYTDSSSFFIVRIATVLALFCFHTYTVMAIFFAVFSFSGAWVLFRTFCRLYPLYYKKIALAIFFIPSVFFWSSGLLKDSITFGALGWFFYAFCNLFIFHRRFTASGFLLLLSAYLLLKIKIYILLSLLPGLIFWLFLNYKDRIKSRELRFLSQPVFLGAAVFTAFFSAKFVGAENKQYELSNLSNTIATNATWLGYVSQAEGGSYYSLGKLDGTMGNLISKIPGGIWVTLFRPYLWEVRNPVMLMSALESFVFLILTIYTLLKTGIFRSFRIISSDPFLIFSLIFSLVFAFAVGISSYNFGTLVRYKIPMMPFYLILLLIVFEKGKRLKQSKRNT